MRVLIIVLCCRQVLGSFSFSGVLTSANDPCGTIMDMGIKAFELKPLSRVKFQLLCIVSCCGSEAYTKYLLSITQSHSLIITPLNTVFHTAIQTQSGMRIMISFLSHSRDYKQVENQFGWYSRQECLFNYLNYSLCRSRNNKN